MQERKHVPAGQSVAALMRSEPSPAEAYLIDSQAGWSRSPPWRRTKPS